MAIDMLDSAAKETPAAQRRIAAVRGSRTYSQWERGSLVVYENASLGFLAATVSRWSRIDVGWCCSSNALPAEECRKGTPIERSDSARTPPFGVVGR
jgi:hypothetical protein